MQFWVVAQYSLTRAGEEEAGRHYFNGTDQLKVNGLLSDEKLQQAAKNQILNKFTGTGRVLRAHAISAIIDRDSQGLLQETTYTGNTEGAPPLLTPEDLATAATAAKRLSGLQEGANINPGPEAMYDHPEEPPHKRKKVANTEGAAVQDLLSRAQRNWDCTAEDCDFTTSSEMILLEHFKTSCPGNPARAAETNEALKVKFAEHEVTIKNRVLENVQDDNNMLLTPARCWSAPANWLAYQSLALKGQTFIRWNYDFTKLGLIVKNKRLVLEIHNPACKYTLPSVTLTLLSPFAVTEIHLKHFTKDNLQKSSGTAKPIKDNTTQGGVAWEEDFDSIKANATEDAKLAWSKHYIPTYKVDHAYLRNLGNWVDINRLVHPALLDCVAAYKAIVDAPKLDVKTLCDFFTRHVENRASAAAAGGATNLWGKLTHRNISPLMTHVSDYPAASNALAMILQAQLNQQILGNNFKPNKSYKSNHGSNNNRGYRGRGSNRGGYRGGYSTRNNSSHNTGGNNNTQASTTDPLY